MPELMQDDWDWLQKLAMIRYRPTNDQVPSDGLLRLIDVGYIRKDPQDQFVITPRGRRAIKARDSGEEY